jgi:23S rRNA (uracil1939-C5)-methyltransferase
MNQQFHSKIESMAFKGYGVARIEGKLVFIPFSATGDEGWIELVEEKKNYAMGRLKKLTQSSPWRVDPPCPYFGVCGGCQWQHIDYSFHGEIKKGIFEEILHRLGRVKEAPIIQVIPSPDSYGYRVRVQLRVKNGRMGYYRERSHQLVDIDRCQISHSLINQIILSLRKELSSFPPLKEIEINVSPEEEKGGLVVHLHSSSRGRKHFAESLLQSCPVLKGVAVIQEGRLTLSGDPLLHYTIYSTRSIRIRTRHCLRRFSNSPN